MRRWRLRVGLTGTFAVILLMLLASAGESATGGSYKGKTAQQEPVSFEVSGGEVRGFRYKIKERCPDGHTLIVTASGYPRMPIAHSKFGGSFAPVGGHAGEGSVIKGRLSGRRATGSIKNAAFSPRERRLCHGSAMFNASRR